MRWLRTSIRLLHTRKHCIVYFGLGTLHAIFVTCGFVRGATFRLHVLAIWDAVESSMHWMHLDETAPTCILHVYAPVCETPLSTLMKYIFQIYIPSALICAGRELWGIGGNDGPSELRISITKAHTGCRARLNWFYMCFAHAWRHDAYTQHVGRTFDQRL